MIKYLSIWIVSTFLTSFILFQLASSISGTTFTNVFSEFEILLVLIGFSFTISTILTCTIFLYDKFQLIKTS